MCYLKHVLTRLIVFSTIAIIISSCQHESPLSAELKNSTQSTTDFSYQPLISENSPILENLSMDNYLPTLNSVSYPQNASCFVRFFKNWDQYRGSGCQIPNGSFFEFQHAALSPPSETTWGEDITITMTVEMDSLRRELVYSFGPSGCTFDPPAKLWIDWSDLGSDKATLFYLKNDGTREVQLPDQIDVYNKHMCIYINHFSRYAVAYSNSIDPKLKLIMTK